MWPRACSFTWQAHPNPNPRLDNANTHGTGCTLSSSAAAFLAQGLPLPDAVVLAKAYVSQGIRGAVQLGAGPGPVRQTGWPGSAHDFPWCVPDFFCLSSVDGRCTI